MSVMGAMIVRLPLWCSDLDIDLCILGAVYFIFKSHDLSPVPF